MNDFQTASLLSRGKMDSLMQVRSIIEFVSTYIVANRGAAFPAAIPKSHQRDAKGRRS